MQVKMHHLITASLELFVVGKDALSSFFSLLITQYLLLNESWHVVIYCKKNSSEPHFKFQWVACVMMWSAVNYWLWYSFTIKNDYIVKPFERKWEILVWKSKESERLNLENFMHETFMCRKVYHLFLCKFWWNLKNLTSCMGKLCIQNFLI
jgi:hypothetical protein